MTKIETLFEVVLGVVGEITCLSPAGLLDRAERLRTAVREAQEEREKTRVELHRWVDKPELNVHHPRIDELNKMVNANLERFKTLTQNPPNSVREVPSWYSPGLGAKPDQTPRLECLKVAAQIGLDGKTVFQRAEELLSWIKGEKG